MPKANPRTELFSMKLLPLERALLRNAAAECGTTESGFARPLVIGTARMVLEQRTAREGAAHD